MPRKQTFLKCLKQFDSKMHFKCQFLLFSIGESFKEGTTHNNETKMDQRLSQDQKQSQLKMRSEKAPASWTSTDKSTSDPAWSQKRADWEQRQAQWDQKEAGWGQRDPQWGQKEAGWGQKDPQWLEQNKEKSEKKGPNWNWVDKKWKESTWAENQEGDLDTETIGKALEMSDTFSRSQYVNKNGSKIVNWMIKNLPNGRQTIIVL